MNGSRRVHNITASPLGSFHRQVRRARDSQRLVLCMLHILADLELPGCSKRGRRSFADFADRRPGLRKVQPGLGSPHECLSASEHPPAQGSSWDPSGFLGCFSMARLDFSLPHLASCPPVLWPRPAQPRCHAAIARSGAQVSKLVRRRRSGAAPWCFSSPPAQEIGTISTHPWKLGQQLLSSSPLTATR